jgi:hypothetical protein
MAQGNTAGSAAGGCGVKAGWRTFGMHHRFELGVLVMLMRPFGPALAQCWGDLLLLGQQITRRQVLGRVEYLKESSSGENGFRWRRVSVSTVPQVWIGDRYHTGNTSSRDAPRARGLAPSPSFALRSPNRTRCPPATACWPGYSAYPLKRRADRDRLMREASRVCLFIPNEAPLASAGRRKEAAHAKSISA